MPSYQYTVAMTCEGCANAVRRNLGKLEGVEKVDISVSEKKVVVSGSAAQEDVFSAIKKTGKECSYVGAV